MHAGEDLLDAFRHRPLIFVEPGNSFALARIFPLLVLTEFHVAADRHEVNQIFRQQIEPLAEFPAIQQIGFVVQELLDLLLQFEVSDAMFHSAALWSGWRSRPSNESHASPFIYRA